MIVPSKINAKSKIILSVTQGARGAKGISGDLRPFTSELSPDTETIIPGKTIGDFLGKPLKEILEQLLTSSVVPTIPTTPTNNIFPYTLPFTLS